MKTFDNEKWTRIRARGHARFLLRRGILFWGVPFGLIVPLAQFLYDRVTCTPTSSIWTIVGSFVLLAVVFGYGMGETEWRRSERAYHESAV